MKRNDVLMAWVLIQQSYEYLKLFTLVSVNRQSNPTMTVNSIERNESVDSGSGGWRWIYLAAKVYIYIEIFTKFVNQPD